MRRRFAVALACLTLLPAASLAADYGPGRDVAHVRSDARRLLAHRVRAAGADPRTVAITDVVVVRDQAILSWNSGKQHGIMGLVRYLDRWWDALDKVAPDAAGAAQPSPCWGTTLTFPLTGRDLPASPPDVETLQNDGFSSALAAAAAQSNADVRRFEQISDAWRASHSSKNLAAPPLCEDDVYEIKTDLAVHPNGGSLHPPRASTSGYDMAIRFSRNDALPNAQFTQIYGRSPTKAEMLPDPAPPRDVGGPTDVFYFDLALRGAQPVTFANGTAIDIWFPFVLDDSLRYHVSFFSMGKAYGPYSGTLFDNVLHFELPQFAMKSGDTLMADVDGWY